jgi:AcrR family transcriptional regulator
VIDRDAVADAVEGLYVEGGIDAVSIVGAAQRLDVSRATLYRTVPNKEDLVGILFERSMHEQVECQRSRNSPGLRGCPSRNSSPSVM